MGYEIERLWVRVTHLDETIWNGSPTRKSYGLTKEGSVYNWSQEESSEIVICEGHAIVLHENSQLIRFVEKAV